MTSKTESRNTKRPMCDEYSGPFDYKRLEQPYTGLPLPLHIQILDDFWGGHYCIFKNETG